MAKRWEKIVDEYESKAREALELAEGMKAREIVFQNETVAEIAKKIKSKKKELNLKTDYIMQKAYSYNDKFFDILDEKTKAKLNEEASYWTKKHRELKDKMTEVRAMLEIADTYEQIKEILLHYEIIDWNKKEESN